MSLKPLSDTLWRERELLERLLFKLEVEQLLLASGRTGRLPLATRELEEVLEAIRTTELGRAVEVDNALTELGLPDGASLLDIAAVAPAPWDGILREHRNNFVRLTGEIGELSHGTRVTLATAVRATQETLMGLHDGLDTYDPSGAASATRHGAQLVDETS